MLEILHRTLSAKDQQAIYSKWLNAGLYRQNYPALYASQGEQKSELKDSTDVLSNDIKSYNTSMGSFFQTSRVLPSCKIITQQLIFVYTIYKFCCTYLLFGMNFSFLRKSATYVSVWVMA